MTTRYAFVVAALVTITVGGVRAQSTAAPPSSRQSTHGMGDMPGMGGASSADMNAMMKQCAQMKSQMRTGMKMTPEMQPTMDRCDKMDRSMGAGKAPDDTLSR